MEFEMTYNTQEDHMIIAEYGRHIQNLVDHCKKIVDLNERQRFAEQIVNLMYQMNPQSKNTLDYKTKLWKHLFMISNYEINVAPTSGEIPQPEDRMIKPDIVDYPNNESSFRHYGFNVRLLIEKAIAMEDGPIKDGFVETIASFMKMAYKNWNREHYVSDEIVLQDLKAMTQGKLTVADERTLDTLSAAVKNKKRRPSNNNNNNRRRNNNNNNNRNHRRRR